MKVKCPTCGKPTQYSKDNPVRPFCSERCQALDLGAWADEKYRVPDPIDTQSSESETGDDSLPVNENPASFNAKDFLN